MFIKGNKIYSDAYKYLVNKKNNSIGFIVDGIQEEYNEVSLPTPLSLESINNGFYRVKGTRIMFYFSNSDYVTVKTEMIKKRYSNDDQIAIMLNYQIGSEEDVIIYNKMQEWRAFASDIALKISSLNI